ncbi:hypothetical protein VTN77DRAFT_2265 [Rasamsonia byssochlamydoides]|uniref:uncharacterized protein n=1 Tax=Rasamsonia byssochlamydoides TaxID=89139 RepID=UPI00374458B0
MKEPLDHVLDPKLCRSSGVFRHVHAVRPPLMPRRDPDRLRVFNHQIEQSKAREYRHRGDKGSISPGDRIRKTPVCFRPTSYGFDILKEPERSAEAIWSGEKWRP